MRANWHLDHLDLPDTDPMQEITVLEQTGAVIDLTKLEADLCAELEREVAMESRFQARGVACELKWEARHVLMGGKGLSCYTCPKHTGDPNQERSVVCRIGRKQVDLYEQLQAVRAADSLDSELAFIHERDIEACAELAEARLAPSP